MFEPGVAAELFKVCARKLSNLTPLRLLLRVFSFERCLPFRCRLASAPPAPFVVLFVMLSRRLCGVSSALVDALALALEAELRMQRSPFPFRDSGVNL